MGQVSYPELNKVSFLTSRGLAGADPCTSFQVPDKHEKHRPAAPSGFFNSQVLQKQVFDVLPN